MDISKYTLEDFVLDPSFRNWVLDPNAGANVKWEKLLNAFPSKYPEAEKAREIIIHLYSKKHQQMDADEFLGVWDKIEGELTESTSRRYDDEKIIPLNSLSTFGKSKLREERSPQKSGGYLRAAGVVFFLVALGFLTNHILRETAALENLTLEMAYEERSTPPGVKAYLTLSDGSEIILNAGSKIRYIKNFQQDKREVILQGEAFFKVAKDTLRPFSVVTGKVKTTALGTSFNIKSYRIDMPDISLITGQVSVELLTSKALSTTLSPGEAADVDVLSNSLKKGSFDRDSVIGWTQKLLVFHKTPLSEALQVLENWYGVTFEIHGEIGRQVHFNGKFHAESLDNVLKGLGYASGFEFEIKGDKVIINF